MAIKDGSKVTLEYEGKLESGEIFDSTEKHGKPLVFEVGKKQLIPGFEKGVIGLKEGDKKEIEIEAKDAYGEPNPQLINKVPKKMFPKEQEPKEGMHIALQGPDGRQIPAKIAKIEKEEVTLDLNHPLAGKKLIFNVSIQKIE